MDDHKAWREPSSRKLYHSLWLCCLAALLVFLSVVLLDRPIATLSEQLFGGAKFVGSFAATPSFFDLFIVILFATSCARRIARVPFAKIDAALILAIASLLLANWARTQLKFAFGRTWPKYEHPSFVYDGAFGFHPFHPGHAFESFPSGHALAVAAVGPVLLYFYPRLRHWYWSCLVAVSSLLIVTNYHFLSDVIAGSFVGFLLGSLVLSVMTIWRRAD